METVEAEIGSLRPKVGLSRPRETVEVVIGSSRPVKGMEAKIQSLRLKEAVVKLKSGSRGCT